MSSNRGHRAGQCAPEVPRTRISARGDLQELCHGQPAASFATQHLRPWLETALSSTQHPYPQPNGSNLLHLIPASWPGDSLIRRRYRGGVAIGADGPKDLRLSEQMQSMEKDFQRSRELFRTDRGRPCPSRMGGPASEAKRGDGAKRKSVRKSCRSAGDHVWKTMRQHREAAAS